MTTKNKKLEENMPNARDAFADAIDNLCDKMEPYVRSAFSSLPEYKPIEYDIDRNALEKEISNEESDKNVVKLLADEMINALSPPDPEILRETRIKLYTELITASWYETLRWSAKGNNVVQLRDYLLPEDLGRVKSAWDTNIGRLDFSQEQVEDILRKFGEEEIAYCLELPGGSYISRATGGYELRWNKEK